MIDRRQSRILAMQALCQLEVAGEEFMTHLVEFLNDESPPPGVSDYACELVRGIWSGLAELDARIQAAALAWDLKRMNAVDRNVLRVAVCEMLHRPAVPRKAVINEAVEIAKAFSTAESGAFINGILDAIRKSLEAAPAIEPPTLPETLTSEN